MSRILALALILVPLAAGGAFSDFDQPKAVLLAGLGLVFAWRLLRDGPGGPGLARSVVIPALLGLGVLALGAVLARGADLIPVSGELARLALAIVILAVASRAERTSRRLLLVAGAAVPTLLLGAQLLLEAGLFPFAVPFRAGEFTATIGNRGLVAELAVLSLGFGVALAALPGRGTRVAGLLFLVADLGAIVLADSRSGWLGAAAAGAVAGLVAWFARGADRSGREAPRPGRGAGLVALGLLALVLGVFGAARLEVANPLTRLATAVDPDHPSNRVRLELAADAWAMWRDHPIFGVGPGRFGLEHPAYRGAREWSLSGVTSHVRTPHDEPLRILAESGLLGALAALFVLWRLVRALGRRALRGEPADRAVALGALAGLGGLLATSLVWFPFRQPATLLMAAALVGAALRTRDERPAGRLAVALGLVAIGASLLLLLFAEADAAGTAARDRLEAGKRELARVLREEPASAWPPAITAVGGDATRCLQAGRRSLVGPELRYRLLLGAADLVAEARRLEALANRLEDDAWRAPVANAARAFPSDRELQEGLEEAAERAPKHLLLVRLLARTELARGRTAEADSRLRARLVENPDTPLVRRDLADLCLADVAQASGPTSAALYETAIDLLEDELERYPRGVEGDATWEKLARATGRQGRLTDALEVVREWNRRAGSSDLRWSVGGEIALRFGESPESLGRFLAAEAPGYAPPDVASAVAALDGLEPAEAHRRLLAMLGRHPDDPAVLAALERVIADLSASSPDPEVRRRYRDDRSRAIARAKVLYAAEQLRDGEIRLARISLRAALRTWPAQGDAHVLGALLALRDGDETGAIEVLLEWRRQGFSRPSALAVFPDLAPLLSHPKLASWIESEG